MFAGDQLKREQFMNNLLDTSNPSSSTKNNMPLTHQSVDGKKLIFSGGAGGFNNTFVVNNDTKQKENLDSVRQSYQDNKENSVEESQKSIQNNFLEINRTPSNIQGNNQQYAQNQDQPSNIKKGKSFAIDINKDDIDFERGDNSAYFHKENVASTTKSKNSSNIVRDFSNNRQRILSNNVETSSNNKYMGRNTNNVTPNQRDLTILTGHSIQQLKETALNEICFQFLISQDVLSPINIASVQTKKSINSTYNTSTTKPNFSEQNQSVSVPKKSDNVIQKSMTIKSRNNQIGDILNASMCSNTVSIETRSNFAEKPKNMTRDNSISQKSKSQNKQKNLSVTQLMSDQNTPSTLQSRNMKYANIDDAKVNLDEKTSEYLDWSQLSLPLTPNEVLEKFSKYLSEYERDEIMLYKRVELNLKQALIKIYFIGHTSAQNKHAEGTQNDKFDDSKGEYLYSLLDHIAYRYQILELLGKGSFGQVFKVYDHQRQEFLALQIIRNKQKFHTQALIELNILTYIKEKDADNQTNLVKIKDFVIFRKHVCLVFELLSINLYDLLQNNNFQGLSLELIRRFAIQVLNSINFLKKHRLVHCDLKPENILLKQINQSGIQIIDFGSSCFENQRLYTYIQSRYYRSPQVILGIPYDMAIDMWSFGCIMAELFQGFPIFPGQDQQEQMMLIMEVVGAPNPKFLQRCSRRQHFFNESGDPFLNPDSEGKIRIPGSKDLKSILNCSDDSFVDFIKQCFVWEPEHRMTPREGLLHPWILEGLPPEIRSQHIKYLQEEAHLQGLSQNEQNAQNSQVLRQSHNAMPESTSAIKSNQITNGHHDENSNNNQNNQNRKNGSSHQQTRNASYDQAQQKTSGYHNNNNNSTNPFPNNINNSFNHSNNGHSNSNNYHNQNNEHHSNVGFNYQNANKNGNSQASENIYHNNNQNNFNINNSNNNNQQYDDSQVLSAQSSNIKENQLSSPSNQNNNNQYQHGTDNQFNNNNKGQSNQNQNDKESLVNNFFKGGKNLPILDQKSMNMVQPNQTPKAGSHTTTNNNFIGMIGATGGVASAKHSNEVNKNQAGQFFGNLQKNDNNSPALQLYPLKNSLNITEAHLQDPSYLEQQNQQQNQNQVRSKTLIKNDQ